MSIAEAVKDLEDHPHIATGNMRWRRPKGGNDNDLILEQEWSVPCNAGRHVYWAPVQTVLED